MEASVLHRGVDEFPGYQTVRDLCDKRRFVDVFRRFDVWLVARWNDVGGKDVVWRLWETNKGSWDEEFVLCLLEFLEMMDCEDHMVEVCLDVLSGLKMSLRDRMVRWVSKGGIGKRMKRKATARDKFRIEILYQLSMVEMRRGNYVAAQNTLNTLNGLLERLEGIPRVQKLNVLSGLVDAMLKMGEYERAKSLLMNLVRMRSLELGEEHRDTLSSMCKLSLVHTKMTEFEDAEKLMKRVFAIREKNLGWGHVSTLQALQDLAVIYLEKENVEEAEEAYRIVQEIQTIELGSHHPNTIATRNILAAIWALSPRLKEF